MGRKSGIRFFRERKGYFTTVDGVRHRLLSCEEDDSPIGPNYLAALEAFKVVLLKRPQPREQVGTVRQLVDAYLADPTIRASKSFSSLASQIRAFGKAHGGCQVRVVSANVVKRWLSGRADWNTSTRAVALKRVKACFAWAANATLLPSNPLSGMRCPDDMGIEGRGDEFAIPADLAALLIDLADEPLKWLLRGLHGTGARPVELRNAQGMHWRPDHGAIVFKSNVKEGYRWKNARKRKRGLRDRWILLPADMVDEVNKRARGNAYLFPGPGGGMWPVSTLTDYFGRLRALPTVHAWHADRNKSADATILYGFRHGYATDRIREKANLKALADAMGTSVQMLEEHYCHLMSNPADVRRMIGQE